MCVHMRENTRLCTHSRTQPHTLTPHACTRTHTQMRHESRREAKIESRQASTRPSLAPGPWWPVSFPHLSPFSPFLTSLSVHPSPSDFCLTSLPLSLLRPHSSLLFCSSISISVSHLLDLVSSPLPLGLFSVPLPPVQLISSSCLLCPHEASGPVPGPGCAQNSQAEPAACSFPRSGHFCSPFPPLLCPRMVRGRGLSDTALSFLGSPCPGVVCP